MSNQINLEFQLGETWTLDFDLNDENSEDIDLTGAVVSFMMVQDDIVVLSMSSDDLGSGISIDSPTIGTGSIILSPTDQLYLTPGVYNFSVQATLADQTVTNQIRGKIFILANIFSWPVQT